MQFVRVRNIEEAFDCVNGMRARGVLRESRYGPCYDFGPMTWQFDLPWERVLFHPERDANPFFQFYEAMWMLAGGNKVEPLAFFNKRMAEFSDDGEIFHGAYGYRWRYHFLVDQIESVIRRLKEDEMTRRAVISIYDGAADSEYYGKDLPCNLNVCFSARTGKLDMTVFNRSNDLIWGLLGTNHVHFSILQEVIAGLTAIPIGKYRHVSCDVHAYVATLKEWYAPQQMLYRGQQVMSPEIVRNPASFREEFGDWMFALEKGHFLEDGADNTFLTHVASPFMEAWWMWKGGDRQEAYDFLEKKFDNEPVDWFLAGKDWMGRRLDK